MRPLALLVLPVLLALVGAPAAVAQPALVAVPGGTTDEQVRLVVRVPDGARPEGFSASVDGVAQPVTSEPMVSDRMAMGLVVDASADGSPVLPAGLGGAANFVLAAPPSARGALVLDTAPPTVAVPWPSAPAAILGGLSGVRSGGTRSTAAALDLAVAQLPTGATEPRVVVLYTSAPDAGGEPAPAIVERLRSAGVVLAVVSAAGGDAAPGFWTVVATGTGGVAVSAPPADAIAAFEQVTAALERSYVLTFPTPARLPATATVSVETAAGPLTNQVPVPPAPPPPEAGPNPLVLVAMGAFVAVVLGASVPALRRRRPAPNGTPSAAPERPDRVGRTHQAWNVPTGLDAPVDRTAVLAEVAAALPHGRPVWLRPHPGPPGVGTTTAMVEFAQRNRDHYDVVWVVPALDPDLVPDRMAELAEALGLATATDPADAATATLLDALPRRRRWLLIFDDAGSPRQLTRYVPDGPGDVLVASSDPGWAEVATPVAVPAFTRAESVSLLRARRPEFPDEEAHRLAATLRDLPLAVDPAAALLADPATTPDDLGRLVHDAPGAESWEAVWAASWDRLAADDPQALALLTLAAWLGPAPTPLSLVAGHPDAVPEPLATAARTPAALVDRTATLRRGGLAGVTADDLQLHPAPGQLLITRTREDHASDGGWAAIAVRLLRAAAPDGSAKEPGTRSAWRRLLPHVLAATDPTRKLDVVAEDVGWLLRHAGHYLEATGRGHAARALLDDADGVDVGAASDS